MFCETESEITAKRRDMKLKKIIMSIFIVILLVSLFFWSPWITKDFAESRVIERFEKINSRISDGCGFNCKGCGVINSNKVAFGYVITIEYACGLLPRDSKEFHQKQTKYVSFIGSVR